jgi:hypothetical protein
MIGNGLFHTMASAYLFQLFAKESTHGTDTTKSKVIETSFLIIPEVNDGVQDPYG